MDSLFGQQTNLKEYCLFQAVVGVSWLISILFLKEITLLFEGYREERKMKIEVELVTPYPLPVAVKSLPSV